jgi:hypothetical protein
MKVFNHAGWKFYKEGAELNDPPWFAESIGELALSYVQYVIVPDSVDPGEYTPGGEFLPALAEFIINSAVDVIEIAGGNTFRWSFVNVFTGNVLASIIADYVLFELTAEIVIKTQNFSLSGKGNIDVATQLGLKKDGEIWLWRVFFSVLVYDERLVDVQYNNPNRFYFGLVSFSNFGAFAEPYWLRTKEHYRGIFQVTPNAEGKDINSDAGFPNLLYNYIRHTGFSFDLRKSVLAQAKVSAVKLLSDVENWW